MDFTGPGTVYLQTRDYERFVSDIISGAPSTDDDGVDVDVGGANTGGFVGNQP
jgi:hypothetical protein